MLRPVALSMQSIKHLEENHKADFDEHDVKVLKAKVTGKPFSEMTAQELDRELTILLARIGVITGINIPSNPMVFELTCKELANHITEDSAYSKMTSEEVINAFHLFSKGLIGGDKKDYGKTFNLEYFSVIVQSYLRYRSIVFIRVEDVEARSIIQESGEKHPDEINYYETTEMAYQQYLSGKYNFMIWNPNCYDTCVKLKWIEEGANAQYLEKAKSKLIVLKSDEVAEFEKTSIKLDGNIYSTKDNLAINVGKLMSAVFDLSKIKNGEPGWLIVNVSKQLCLEAMFKQFALEGKECLFIKED